MELVKLLIKSGADVNMQTEGGETPLMKAVMMGKPGVIEEILKHNPNTELSSSMGDTVWSLV